MKKQNLKKMLNLRSFALIAILSVAVFATSCNKDDDGYIPSESEMMLKKGHADAGKPDDVPRAAPAPGDASIAQIAINEGFDSLVVALQYVDMKEGTELVDLFMNGTDQYTVFAPTNDAFKALVGDDQISDLPSDLVLQVLLYHVTEGRRAANSVVPPMGTRTITTLLEAAFTVDSDGVITDIAGQEVNILIPNISASNGIIHVIDTVLLPLE